MGWSYFNDPNKGLKDVIKEISADTRYVKPDGSINPLLRGVTQAHCLRGLVLWTVVSIQSRDTEDGEWSEVTRYIGCHLLQRASKTLGAGHKDMDESMGPYEYSCPLAYLDMVPVAPKGSEKWREKVRQYHAIQAKKKALTEGQRIKLSNPIGFTNGYSEDTFTVVRLPRKQPQFRSVKYGWIARIPAETLDRAGFELL